MSDKNLRLCNFDLLGVNFFSYQDTLADLEGGGGYGGCHPPPPFQISKTKESNKTKQKIEDNPLEKEEERNSCMFV